MSKALIEFDELKKAILTSALKHQESDSSFNHVIQGTIMDIKKEFFTEPVGNSDWLIPGGENEN